MRSPIADLPPLEWPSARGDPLFTAEEVADLRVLFGIPPSPQADSSAPATAGPSHEPPAAPARVRGQPPLNSERVHRLVQARELLASGLDVKAVNQQAGVDSRVIRDVFDNSGRLRLSERACALLRWHERDAVAGLRELPRALTHADERTLAGLLRRHAAEPLPNLRQAGADAGMQPEALEFLFDPAGWLRADRVNALPDNQRQALARAVEHGQAQAAGVAVPAAPLPRSRGTDDAEIERAGRLMQAQAMLAAGQSPTVAAAHAGTDRWWLAKMLDKAGRVVLSAAGQRLIDCPDQVLGAKFAAMPRSLWPKDLYLLTELLQRHDRPPMDQLRQAAAEAGVSPQALDYLFDEDGALRQDRIASLPQQQREYLLLAIEPVGGARRGPAEVQHARTLAIAQALLASGSTIKEVAHDLTMSRGTLSKVLDTQGRLLLVSHALRLLNCPDPALAAQFAAVPRALRQRDLRSLAELLRLRGGDAPADLRAAASDRRMEPEALDYLFDAGGRLRQDRLATLPDDQRQVLEAAAGQQPAPAARGASASVPRPSPASARPPRPVPARAPVGQPTSTSSAGGTAASLARQSVRERPATTVRPPRPTVVAQAPSPIAGSAEASAVLQFFRRHRQPIQAFHEAQATFRMSRSALLQLLARAGITELEALGGQIPVAGVLWQRLRGQVRPEGAAAPRAAVPVASPSHGLDDFAASLEDLLATPSGPSSSGKRSADQAFGPESSRGDRSAP